MAPTVVLVHGAFGNASGWCRVSRELVLRGHRTLAVDLPGHGDDRRALSALSTDDDVTALTAVLRRAKEHGPVVLVGHSRGGLAITAVANTAPELIDHLVYASAWCCVDRTPTEYGTTPEYAGARFEELGPALAVGDPAALGLVRLDWRTSEPAVLDLAQEILLADGTRADLRIWLDAMGSDETLLLDDDLVRVHPASWGRVPHTYVRATEDRALPVGLQDRFVAEADAATPGNPFRTVTIPTSHLGLQVHPDPVVDALEDVLVT